MPRSIRSAKKILDLVGNAETFYFSIRTDLHSEALSKIGIPSPIEPGVEILPKGIGKFTKFNAHGREIIRDDLPKEVVYKMVWGTTRDWHGNTHSQLQNRKFLMYPRDWVEAPEELLKTIKVKNEIIITSRAISTKIDSSESIVFLANIFLEIFGEFLLISENLEEFIPTKIKRLTWEVLPPGSYPFEKMLSFTSNSIKEFNEPERKVSQLRISNILSYKPDFIATGNGGFNGYIVIGFQEKNLYVLESPLLGNATYIFKGEWESVSKLTKKDIIKNNLHAHRLIHSKSWKIELRRVLDAVSK